MYSYEGVHLYYVLHVESLGIWKSSPWKQFWLHRVCSMNNKIYIIQNTSALLSNLFLLNFFSLFFFHHLLYFSFSLFSSCVVFFSLHVHVFFLVPTSHFLILLIFFLFMLIYFRPFPSILVCLLSLTVSVVLFNVLIAQLSHTYQMVQEDSHLSSLVELMHAITTVEFQSRFKIWVFN